MALTPQFELQYYTDCESVDYVDLTEYGSPEKERNTVGVFLYVQRRKEDPADDLDLSPTISDPSSDSTFNFVTAEDGWYEFTMLIIDTWTGTEIYNTDDVVHSGTVIYKALIDSIPAGTSPSTNPNEWEVVSDYTTIVDNSTVVSLVSNEIIDCRGRACHVEQLCAADCLDCDSRSIPIHTKIFNMLTAARAKCIQQLYLDAEKITRTTEIFCSNL